MESKKFFPNLLTLLALPLVLNLILRPSTSNASILDSLTPIPAVKNLVIPTINQTKYYLNFAAAINCGENNDLLAWNCSYCNLTGPDVELVAVIIDPISGTAAIINQNNATRDVILTFRGSVTATNWVADLVFFPVPFGPGPPNARVHVGFLGLTNILIPMIKPLLLPLLTPGQNLIVAGHSLGAALATLGALTLIHDLDLTGLNLNYSLYAYASPRVGNLAFAAWVNSHNFTAIRVVSQKDPVPHVPPSFLNGNPVSGLIGLILPSNFTFGILGLNYVHISTELWIQPDNSSILCSNTVYEDPNCSNSVGLLQFKLLDHLEYWHMDLLKCWVDDPCTIVWNIATGLAYNGPSCGLLG